MTINNILNGVISGKRLNDEDAICLFKNANLHELGEASNLFRKQKHPDNRVTFIIDRNINYTNICINQCSFCAFYRDNDSADRYLLSSEEILQKVEEAVSNGATQIMLQGGLHPDLKINYFCEIFRLIKDKFSITIHSLSAPEIVHISRNSNLSLNETLKMLKEAGLDSLPGGGAEILNDNIRHKISPKKISSSEWFSVMKSTHDLGIWTTATMMFGIGEAVEDRIDHLKKVRDLQDKTGKFRAFIPWTFQPGNTTIGGKEVCAKDYLMTLSISRIYLDNISNIQGSWLTQGEEIGQLSLFFGANDLGSIMLEENVVRAAGVCRKMNVDKIISLIKKADFIPAQRDTEYRVLKEYN